MMKAQASGDDDDDVEMAAPLVQVSTPHGEAAALARDGVVDLPGHHDLTAVRNTAALPASGGIPGETAPRPDPYVQDFISKVAEGDASCAEYLHEIFDGSIKGIRQVAASLHTDYVQSAVLRNPKLSERQRISLNYHLYAILGDGLDSAKIDGSICLSVRPIGGSSVLLPLDSSGSERFEAAGDGWELIPGALTQTKVEVSQVSGEVDKKTRQAIRGELETRLGARLNLHGASQRTTIHTDNGKEMGESTGLRTTFMLRCKAHGTQDDCKFMVKVEVQVDNPDSTRVEIKGRHSCSQNKDYTVKQDGLTQSQKRYVASKLDGGLKPPTQVEDDIIGMTHEQQQALGLRGNSGKLPTRLQIQKYAKSRKGRVPVLGD